MPTLDYSPIDEYTTVLYLLHPTRKRTQNGKRRLLECNYAYISLHSAPQCAIVDDRDRTVAPVHLYR